ncbi:MAG: nicotinate (nicotinamide) nucleotide adenylyltransferase [Turicibacter sp.]
MEVCDMIVVFGGSFNPPTIAHYHIAKYIIQTLKCDQFIYLPVGNQYPKKGLISANYRIDMLHIVSKHLKHAQVSQIEVEAKDVLTSFQTLTKLKEQDPSQDIGFVIGADNLKDLPQWAQVQELIANFKIIVFRRDHIDVESIISTLFKGYESQFIILEEFEEMPISSTQYRENLNNSDLVLKEVDEDIKQNKLYGRGV